MILTMFQVPMFLYLEHDNMLILSYRIRRHPNLTWLAYAKVHHNIMLSFSITRRMYLSSILPDYKLVFKIPARKPNATFLTQNYLQCNQNSNHNFTPPGSPTTVQRTKRAPIPTPAIPTTAPAIPTPASAIQTTVPGTEASGTARAWRLWRKHARSETIRLGIVTHVHDLCTYLIINT